MTGDHDWLCSLLFDSPGGDSSGVQDQLRNAQAIYATNKAFAAVLADGTVVTWGDAEAFTDSLDLGKQHGGLTKISDMLHHNYLIYFEMLACLVSMIQILFQSDWNHHLVEFFKMHRRILAATEIPKWIRRWCNFVKLGKGSSWTFYFPGGI